MGRVLSLSWGLSLSFGFGFGLGEWGGKIWAWKQEKRLANKWIKQSSAKLVVEEKKLNARPNSTRRLISSSNQMEEECWREDLRGGVMLLLLPAFAVFNSEQKLKLTGFSSSKCDRLRNKSADWTIFQSARAQELAKGRGLNLIEASRRASRRTKTFG